MAFSIKDQNDIAEASRKAVAEVFARIADGQVSRLSVGFYRNGSEGKLSAIARGTVTVIGHGEVGKDKTSHENWDRR